jgi:hypothetical protein
MPQSNNSRRDLLRLVLFTFAAWALWALGRNEAKPGADTATEETSQARQRSGFSKRRLATSLAFATLFFAGAAFTAGAGDQAACLVEDCQPAAAEAVETTTEASDPAEPAAEDPAAEDPAPADPAPADPPAAEDPAPADPGSDSGSDSGADNGSDNAGQDDQPAGDPAASGQPSDDGAAPASGDEGGSPAGDGGSAGGSNDGAGGGNGADNPADQPDSPAAGPDSPSHAGDKTPPYSSDQSEVEELAAHDADVAAETAGAFATIWLHRTLPDPTPAAKRLDARFAGMLKRTAKQQDVDWALVLGVVRARGNLGRWPATRRDVVSVSKQLHDLHASKDAWQAVLGLAGRTGFADRTIALSRYFHAVGLHALVRGLVASKAELQHRVLNDSRISIYAGGRSDVAAGRVDVRVLALIRYMAEAHGSVTVSCLISGHRLYARPGVVSAHIYGEAVDISALGGVSIYGNQQPGGLTEKAVRNILLLPVELRPKQVISLLGLGGPSFALADHYDHIHVGY